MSIPYPSPATLFKDSAQRNAHHLQSIPYLAFFGAFAVVVLALISDHAITLVHFLIAFAFFVVAMASYSAWARRGRSHIPVFALLAGIHLVYFGISGFMGTWQSPSSFDGGFDLSPEIIEAAMAMGLLSLLALWAGCRLGWKFFQNRSIGFRLLSSNAAVPDRIRLLVLAGVVFNYFLPRIGLAPEFRNVVLLFSGTVTLAAYCWVVLALFGGHRDPLDIGLAAAYVLSRLMSGAAQGASLGSVASIILLTGLALMVAQRRVPWAAILTTLAMIIFLQPHKNVVRERIAAGQLSTDSTRNSIEWVSASVTGWSDAIRSGTVHQQFQAIASRTSLLTMAGTVYDKTPNFVPYLEGEFYPLLISNLIPRYFWPDKPTVNVANRAFQVQYGLTSESRLEEVSIACGFGAEGYMNFGWLGVIGASVFAGFFVGSLDSILLGKTRGRCELALGLALLPGLLTIESQMVQYLSGLIPTLVVAYVFLGDWSQLAGRALRRPAVY